MIAAYLFCSSLKGVMGNLDCLASISECTVTPSDFLHMQVTFLSG